MKKVLFIYYHFPPIMGDWRGLGLGGLLPEFGWQPVVIAAGENVKYEKDYSLLEKIPAGIEVHRVGHGEPSKEWQYARSKLRINYDFPDYYKAWYSPAIREARKILQSGKIDLIFSSFPPYTAGLVAMRLKKEFDVPWIADWRDLWSKNEFLTRSYEKTLIRPFRQVLMRSIRKAEKDIIHSADKNIVVCWYHKQQLREIYGVEGEKVEVITNGYDEADFSGLKPFSLYPNKLTILFLGSFYPDYKEPIQKFLQAVEELDKQAEVVFIGRGAVETQQLAGANLTRILHMARKKAFAFASGSDFLLLVMPPYAKWIPGKIYEYLRLGKPVLALVPEDGDPARIVTDSKAGFVLSFEQEKMKEQLRSIFQRWQDGEFKNFQPDKEYVSQFERRNLAKRLADVFNSAMSQK